MSKSNPITCTKCDQIVLEMSPGVPRMHYVRGTNEMCPGPVKEDDAQRQAD